MTVTPTMVYFILLAVYAVLLVKWPEMLLGRKFKGELQAFIDEWRAKYGREFASLLTALGFSLLALSWPIWLIVRLRDFLLRSH